MVQPWRLLDLRIARNPSDGSLRRIIGLYEAWGKPNKAAEYRAMLAKSPDEAEASSP